MSEPKKGLRGGRTQASYHRRPLLRVVRGHDEFRLVSPLDGRLAVSLTSWLPTPNGSREPRVAITTHALERIFDDHALDAANAIVGRGMRTFTTREKRTRRLDPLIFHPACEREPRDRDRVGEWTRGHENALSAAAIVERSVAESAELESLVDRAKVPHSLKHNDVELVRAFIWSANFAVRVCRPSLCALRSRARGEDVALPRSSAELGYLRDVIARVESASTARPLVSSGDDLLMDTCVLLAGSQVNPKADFAGITEAHLDLWTVLNLWEHFAVVVIRQQERWPPRLSCNDWLNVMSVLASVTDDTRDMQATWNRLREWLHSAFDYGGSEYTLARLWTETVKKHGM